MAACLCGSQETPHEPESDGRALYHVGPRSFQAIEAVVFQAQRQRVTDVFSANGEKHPICSGRPPDG